MSTADRVRKWSEQEVVAGTIVGEASGELFGGQVAVACVIRNRVKHPRWWGGGWRSVCIKDWAFSCWRDQVTRIEDNRRANSVAWQTAMRIAGLVIADKLPDVTLGCDHYLNPRGVAELPAWVFLNGRRRAPTIQIGPHEFYCLELAEPWGW